MPASPTAQPPANPLFRQEALESLSAGQRLEGLVQVTSPRRWLSLAMALAGLAAGLLYSVFGGAPTQVPGTGFLLGPTGIDQVDTPVQGTVISLGVTPGQDVGPDVEVAVVEAPSGQPFSVRSLVPGRVLLTLVSPGDVVQPGSPLVEVLPPGSDRQAQIFVSALQGSAVKPGMAVRVNPVNAPAAQYGSIKGTVRSVSDVPLSSAAIASLVGNNDELAEVIRGRTAPLQVQVELASDPSTPTGYAWTSGRGPADPILAATVLTADVVIKPGRPIDLLLDPEGRSGDR